MVAGTQFTNHALWYQNNFKLLEATGAASSDMTDLMRPLRELDS
jgi:hypothetical protein